MEHLEQLNRVWHRVKFTAGWTSTAADETAIDQLPADAWTDSLQQDATATAHVAELTGLNSRLAAWTGTLRLIVRRVKPSARHTNNLTDLERRTGWRYQIVATNIAGIARAPGSHQPQWIDACTGLTPAWKIKSASTKRWACAICLPKPGRSAAAGS